MFSFPSWASFVKAHEHDRNLRALLQPTGRVRHYYVIKVARKRTKKIVLIRNYSPREIFAMLSGTRTPQMSTAVA